ncbi:MAG: hypothetical protein ACK5MK_07300 [Dysgonomonas sp.]
MAEEYKLSFDDETKKRYLAQIKKHKIFDFYRAYNKELEADILLMEIEALLDKEFTWYDICTIQFLDTDYIGQYDFKQQAKLCMQSIFNEFIEITNVSTKNSKPDADLPDETVEKPQKGDD